MKKTKTSLYILIIIASFLLLDVAFARSLTVPVYRIKLLDSYQYEQQYSGRLTSINQSELGFELPPTESGTLIEMNVDTGQYFKKGELLAKLDDRLLQKKIAIYEARLKEIDSNIHLAQKTLNRLIDLQKRDYSSKQSLDEATNQQERLNHQKSSLEQELAEMRIRFEKMKLIAPFDGVVTKRLVSLGSIIRSGQVVLEVIDHQHLQAKIGVPARYLSTLSKGQSVDIFADGQKLSGHIEHISPSRHPITQSHEVVISTTDRSPMNLENVLASISIQVSIKAKGAWVPVSALQQHYRGLWNVYTLTHLSNELYKVNATPVQVLFMNDKKAYIKSNLTNDSLIIKRGLLKVVPGEAVRIRHE